MRDGGDVEDGIRLRQGVVAGVVAERAFLVQWFARINVAIDDEVGVGRDFSRNSTVLRSSPTQPDPSVAEERQSTNVHDASNPRSTAR